jgi:hypothetical protein
MAANAGEETTGRCVCWWFWWGLQVCDHRSLACSVERFELRYLLIGAACKE